MSGKRCFCASAFVIVSFHLAQGYCLTSLLASDFQNCFHLIIPKTTERNVHAIQFISWDILRSPAKGRGGIKEWPEKWFCLTHSFHQLSVAETTLSSRKQLDKQELHNPTSNLSDSTYFCPSCHPFIGGEGEQLFGQHRKGSSWDRFFIFCC